METLIYYLVNRHHPYTMTDWVDHYDALSPRHLFHSEHWCIKKPSLAGDIYRAEELEYLRTNPHEAELRRIFELAKTDYGRIDYSLLNGKIQVWEINSNPTLRTSSLSKFPDRRPLLDEVGEHISEALLAISPDGRERRKSFWHFGLRRSLPWKPRYVR